jgi:hypothetical protein
MLVFPQISTGASSLYPLKKTSGTSPEGADGGGVGVD